MKNPMNLNGNQHPLTLIAQVICAEWRMSKKSIILSSLYGILDKSQHLLAMTLPAVVIDLLMQRQQSQVVAVIFGFSLVLSVISLLIRSIRLHAEALSFRMINLFNLSTKQKSMRVDYKDQELQRSLDLKNRAGEALWEFTDVDSILFTDILSALFVFVVTGTILFSLNWMVWVVIVGIVCTHYVIDKKVIRRVHQLDTELSKHTRKIQYMQDTMQNFSIGKEIRLYQTHEWMNRRFEQLTVAQQKEEAGKEWFLFRVDILRNILNTAQSIFIYGVSVAQFALGKITLGSLTLYIAAAKEIASAIHSLFNSFVELSRVSLYYKDYQDYIQLDETLRNSGSASLVSSQDELPEIEFQDVSFRYPAFEPEDGFVLKNISFKIRRGEHLAIVGENGSGKTTLIKLLCRLYDPTEGKIVVNGQDLRHFAYDDVMKLIAPIFQDDQLFAYTIEENIIFDRKKNDVLLQEVIQKAGLQEKITALKEGLQTQVTKTFDENGVEFSGGEVQKLTIARALYKQAPVIILDEPTSALDPIAEYNLYKRFHDLSQKQTKIFISHRMGSTQFCDRVLVLDQGELAEWDTHDELMKKKGLYYEMYQLQAQYYV